ncbi:MAG: glutamate--tRNA ligase, partial [Chitinophagaceae bacterium]|nr:glutamate--tRNA ligase [Chitinophagaceae bacterium]
SWDQPPVFQSDRANRHIEVAEYLVSKGLAYKCYYTNERFQFIKKEIVDSGKMLKSDRSWANKIESNSYAIIMQSPSIGKLLFSDLVYGNVDIDSNQVDDFVLVRSDGSPTYMIADVVDDHDMKLPTFFEVQII